MPLDVLPYLGELPPDDADLWRFMSLTKLLSHTMQGTAHWARADLLGDEAEGALGSADRALRKRILADHPGAQNLLKPDLDRRLFVTAWCWHESAVESEPLWGKYCPGDVDGVAIVTQLSRLREALRGVGQRVYAGRVTYIDYDKDSIGLGDELLPFFRKRSQFAAEREVRLVCPRWPEQGDEQWTEAGYSAPVRLEACVGQIIAKPGMARWKFNAIGRLLMACGGGDVVGRLRPSSLDKHPER